MGSLVRPTISTAVTHYIRDLKIVSFFSDGRLCTLNGDEFLLKAPHQTKGSIASHGGIPLARHVISSFPTRRRDCVTGYRLYAIREQNSLDG